VAGQTALRKHVSGKSKQKPNPYPEKILEREAPHLRIVDDWLWYAANEVIDGRRRKTELKRGDDHPLAGIPGNGLPAR